jgi:hypothetical protein
MDPEANVQISAAARCHEFALNASRAKAGIRDVRDEVLRSLILSQAPFRSRVTIEHSDRLELVAPEAPAGRCTAVADAGTETRPREHLGPECQARPVRRNQAN